MTDGADGDFDGGGFCGAGSGLVAVCWNKSPNPEAPDVLEAAAPLPWKWLSDRLYMDELYGATVIAFYGWWGKVADWLDRRVWGGVVSAVAWMTRMGAELNRFLDANVVDGGV